MFNRTIIFTSLILGLWSVSTVAAGAVLVRRGGIYLGSFFISFLSPSDQDSCDQVLLPLRFCVQTSPLYLRNKEWPISVDTVPF